MIPRVKPESMPFGKPVAGFPDHAIASPPRATCGHGADPSSLIQHRPQAHGQVMFGYRLLDQRYAGIQTSLMHDGASRIAGHEQNSEPGPLRSRNVRKLPSVHAGHD